MGRLLAILGVALILDAFAIVDLAVIDRSRVRAFNKVVWAIIILGVPFVGALLWFVIGRGRLDSGAVPRTMAPDDDPAFLRSLRAEEAHRERIRRLEQELSELDDDPPKD